MKILLTGGHGFFGRHIWRALEAADHTVVAPSSRDMDCRARYAVDMFTRTRPDAIVHAAASCGGIGANRAAGPRFFDDNIRMGVNVLSSAWENCPEAYVIAMGTVCSYGAVPPRIPFVEEDVYTGDPEPTNRAYAEAKRALYRYADILSSHGMRTCCPLVANLYGPSERSDEGGHVIGSIVAKMKRAKAEGRESVTLWGSGTPTRDFLHVTDAALAMVALVDYQPQGLINVGTGCEVSIRELAEEVRRLVGFEGSIVWDAAMPDGQKSRVMDTTRAADRLGWRASIELMGAGGLESVI